MKRHSILSLKEKPYNLLGMMAVFVFLVSLISSNSAMDINLHDTYFVIADVHIYWFFSALLLFIWSMNIVFNRYLWSKNMVGIHVVLTLITALFFLKMMFTDISLEGIPRRYYAFNEFQQQQKPWFAIVVQCISIALLFVVAQLVFIANVIIGIFRKGSNSATE